jgi:Mce-associated membrane protein
VPPEEAKARPEGAKAGSTSRGVPLPLIAVLGVLAALAVGLAAYFWTQASDADAVARAQVRAPAAAERAAQAVLSYDHESLEVDKEKASRFLTDGYRSDYVDTFESLVAPNAQEVRANVKASVVASSVMLPGQDTGPQHQRVLLFVDQTTTSTATGGEPSTALNRVVLDMVEVDDTWLVDGITSY